MRINISHAKLHNSVNVLMEKHGLTNLQLHILPLHHLTLRNWYQVSKTIRLLGHPSDTSMQAWVLACPNLQLPHCPLASIWYSRTTLTDTPPLAKLCKAVKRNDYID